MRQLGLAFATLAVTASATQTPAPVAPFLHDTSVVSRVRTIEGHLGRVVDSVMRAAAGQGYSGAVVVEKDGHVILEAGYGFANRERRIPFTAGTVAQIGSLTKQFTATAVVDLWRQGRLTFDAPLSRYFSDLPAGRGDITIDQLLTHTAGLQDSCGPDFAPVSRDDLLHRCLALPLVHPPGESVAYSNLGYSVLAALVEQVSGTSLEAYLRSRFLTPLQLRHTGYTFPGLPADSFAVGYDAGVNQGNILDRLAPLGTSNWDLKGNGGMQASAEDMYRWFVAVRNGPRITGAMRAALWAPHARRDSTVHVGYGWFLRLNEKGELKQLAHSGSDGVFYAALVWRPVERLFVYIVSNFGENDLAKSTVHHVIDAVAEPVAR